MLAFGTREKQMDPIQAFCLQGLFVVGDVNWQKL